MPRAHYRRLELPLRALFHVKQCLLSFSRSLAVTETPASREEERQAGGPRGTGRGKRKNEAAARAKPYRQLGKEWVIPRYSSDLVWLRFGMKHMRGVCYVACSAAVAICQGRPECGI